MIDKKYISNIANYWRHVTYWRGKQTKPIKYNINRRETAWQRYVIEYKEWTDDVKEVQSYVDTPISIRDSSLYEESKTNMVTKCQSYKNRSVHKRTVA